MASPKLDMPDEVTVEEAGGIVRMRLCGTPSEEQMRASFGRLRALLARCSPRLMLVDGSGMRMSSEMYAVLKSEALSVEFDRQAVIGIPPAGRVFAKIVARLSGMSDRMRLYATEAEALRWLQTPGSPQ